LQKQPAFLRRKYFSLGRERYWRRIFAAGEMFCADIGRIAAVTLPFLFGEALRAAAMVCARLAIIAGERNDVAA
jgi:hypothetical protein